ncbi:MAG: hypothetical protein HXY34_10170 [Candidatus Thorarchaeota archaeon]|nr:hypothetical protein [Candidatus Thorarchaeota archaeon]
MLIAEVRAGLNYDRGLQPRVIELYEHPDRSLHAVVSDRAEKSLCLGPDGRIAAEVAKRLSRRVTFHSQEDILVRRHRLTLTEERLREVADTLNTNQLAFAEALRTMIRAETAFPMSPPAELELGPMTDAAVGVALSGGVDSTAALLLVRRLARAPLALTVDLGTRFMTTAEREHVISLSRALGVKHEFVPAPAVCTSLPERVSRGEVHPCGQCHQAILESLEDEAHSHALDVLVTGETLPTGRCAVAVKRGLMIVHLPAALALSKYTTEQMCERINLPRQKRQFGCLLLAQGNHERWNTVGPSIYRVLRELDAGVLTTGQALAYVKNILRNRHKTTHRE